MKESNMLLLPQQLPNFVETEYIENITYRALSYIKAGYAIHFRGPAGTGKTTIAKHVAGKLGRPMVWIHGDEGFTTSSLIGGEQGYKSRQVIDNYISSVLKKEENFEKKWVDNRLTVACRNGFTMLYDEFTRSRPEANNILLSILEDKILNLPQSFGQDDPYVPVHPDFTAIFTSNPEEYAGVHKTQDALLDRMITIDLTYFDYDTELAILHQKAQIEHALAKLIVGIIRSLRDVGEAGLSPNMRTGLMVARITKTMEIQLPQNVEIFVDICKDILASQPQHHPQVEEVVRQQVSAYQPTTKRKNDRKSGRKSSRTRVSQKSDSTAKK